MSENSGFFAAIIIPHFDDEVRLRRCLQALCAGGVPEDIEVVVVDNNSPSLPELNGDFPAVRLVVEKRKGAAHARNRGVAETTASYLWFLDADCIPRQDWMSQARQACDLGDIIGGDVEIFDETPAPRSGAEAFETVFAFDCQTYVEEMNFAVTANMLTRRDIFHRTGPFKDGVPEDKEWCQRAVEAGAGIVFAPDLCVSHPSRSDWPALRKKWVRLTKEGFGTASQRPFGRLLWAARAGVVGVSAIFHLRRVFADQALREEERWPAARTLVRLRLTRMGWMLRQAFTGR